ncbi:AMP-binding protein [Nocardia rhizosphaerae]|uniref:AMP-binding protein n=1 Tax=Nocardia rhizosphaerae TaxID=1691571 RepID=A0ABV8L993_9NOCA
MTYTLAAALRDTLARHPERPAITYRAVHGWRTVTWHELGSLVADTCDRLDSFPVGQVVAVIAETDARYPILELALALTGRVTMPLYTTSSHDELRALVAAAPADAMVVGGGVSAPGIGSIPVHRLVDLVPLPGVDSAVEVLSADVEPFDSSDVLQRISGFDPPAQEPALYLQSTGTTAPAGLIELSGAAMAAAADVLADYPTQKHPRFLSFLPTAHISERLLTVYLAVRVAGHTWYGGGLADLQADLRDCRPTLLLAPPPLLRTIRQETETTAAGSAVGRWLVTAVERNVARILAAGRTGVTRRGLGSRLLGRSVRASTGLTSVREIFAGTSPLDASTHAWWEAVGLPVRNVYGQTQIAGAVSSTTLVGARLTGVGTPEKSVRVRIGDDDELLIDSPANFTRYVGPDGPERTTAAFTVDGWLRTGDRARLTEDGELEVIGRTQGVLGPPTAPLSAEVLVGQLAERFGSVDAVVAAPETRDSAVLYLAFRPELWTEADRNVESPMQALVMNDSRFGSVADALAVADPLGVVTAVCLLDGAFGMSTGEVGPTGKLRAWRIHQLRSSDLVARERMRIDALSVEPAS